MKKTALFYGLLIATHSLICMRDKEADMVKRARDKIGPLFRMHYDFECEIPKSMCLRWFVGCSNSRRASPAGLLIGTPESFAGSSYPLIIRGAVDPSHIGLMVFSPWLVTLPSGVQRGLVLKMLYHVRQYKQNYGPLTVDPIHYPKGINQEAAAQALLNLKCLSCARDFMGSLPEKSSTHLTSVEAEELIKTMDKSQCCAYHKGQASLGE